MNKPKLFAIIEGYEPAEVGLIEIDEATGAINGGRSHLVQRIDGKSWDAGNNKNGKLSLKVLMVRPDQLMVVPEGAQQ